MRAPAVVPRTSALVRPVDVNVLPSLLAAMTIKAGMTMASAVPIPRYLSGMRARRACRMPERGTAGKHEPSACPSYGARRAIARTVAERHGTESRLTSHADGQRKESSWL